MTFLIDLANRTYYFEDANIGDALNSRRYQFLAFDSDNLHNITTISELYEAFKHRKFCVLRMDKDTGTQYATISSMEIIRDICDDDEIDAIFEIRDLKSIG